jgi:hypothetical protein
MGTDDGVARIGRVMEAARLQATRETRMNAQ